MLGLEAYHLQSSRTRASQNVAVLLAVDDHGLADNVEDRHTRIERRERILEDDLHLPAHFLELALFQRGNVDEFFAAAVEDLALRGIDGAQNEAPGGGLAAARLADKAQRLSLAVRSDPRHQRRGHDQPSCGRTLSGWESTSSDCGLQGYLVYRP